MKFFRLALLSIALLYANSVFAQSVVVTGSGADKESALKDAMRGAVESVVGTFIDSRTLVDKFAVALDEIYSKSQGFVTDVKVLEESGGSGAYKIKAQIEVNTDPDSQLQNRLAMIMALNDPRIGVVVLQESAGSYDYVQINNDAVSEGAFNEALLNLGFSHIADVSLLAQLQNSLLLNSIYNGETGLLRNVQASGLDYLVLGKSTADSNRVYLPGSSGTYTETMLHNSKALLQVKLIRFATAEIAAVFSAEGSGIEQSDTRAKNKALTEAAAKAAQKLAAKFKQLGAQTAGSMQIKAAAADYERIKRLAEHLRGSGGIKSVYIREYKNGKGMIDIDTELRPHAVLEILRQKSGLNFFVDGISGSSLEISLS